VENPKNIVVNSNQTTKNQDVSGNYQGIECNLISAAELKRKVEISRNAMTPDEISRCSLIISELEKALIEGKNFAYFNVSFSDKMRRNLFKLGYWCGSEVDPSGQERNWVKFS